MILFNPKFCAIWSNLSCPPTDEWRGKMWCIHTVDYSTLRRTNTLTCAAVWRNLEDIMLHEISSHKRTSTVRVYLWEKSKVVKVIEAESRMVAGRSWREGRAAQGWKWGWWLDTQGASSPLHTCPCQCHPYHWLRGRTLGNESNVSPENFKERMRTLLNW